MKNSITIALEISSHELAKETQKLLRDMSDVNSTLWQDSIDEKGGLASSQKPDVIILEDDLKYGPITERLRILQQNFPSAALFVVSEDAHHEHIISAMKAGAKEYLLSPIKGKVLEHAIDDVRSKLATSGLLPKGSVFSFIGSKGGLGTTVLAVNTAIALREKHKGAVSFVDMSWQSGDSSVLLDLPTENGFAELARNYHRLDVALLRAALKTHSSGLEYLGAPYQPELCEEIKPEHVEKTLSLLKNISDQIIVDCSSMLVNDCVLEGFNASNRILIVAELSIPSIRNTVRLMKLFEEVHIERSKIEIVINRYVKHSSLSIEEAEKSLKKKIFWIFPNDYHDVMTSINKGIPLMQLMPHSPSVGNIKAFAERLINPTLNVDYRGVRGIFGQAI